MADPLGVVLLGDGAPTDDVAAGLGRRGLRDVAVRAASPEGYEEAAADLAGHAAVIGLGVAPWPRSRDEHHRVRHALAAHAVPYYAVQSWHRLPVWIEAVAAGLRDALTSFDPSETDAPHVLFTAPGSVGTDDPSVPVALREAAEDVAARVLLPSRSVAWVGGTARPTVGMAMQSLVEAHGRTELLHCSLDPAPVDAAALDEVAAVAGVTRIEHARPDPGSHADALAAAVATVVEHEW